MSSNVTTISTTPVFSSIGATLEAAFMAAKELSEIMGAKEEMDVANSRIIAYLPSTAQSSGEDSNSQIISQVNQRITEILEEIKITTQAEKLLEIGKCYYILGDFPNAYASYLSALRYDQQSFKSDDWYVCGALHQHFTGLQEALDCYSKVNSKELQGKKYRDFTMRLAILSRQVKNYDLAFKLFAALQVDPPDMLTKEDITLQISFTYYQSLKTDDALKMVNELLVQYPENMLLIRESLILQFLITNTSGLQTILPTIIEYYNKYPDYFIRLVLARIYYLLGSYVDSYDYFKGCLDYWAEHPMFWVSIGLLYYQNGQLDLAAIAFQRSIYMKPNGKIAWLNLGFIFEKKNDRENAIKIYNTGIKQCNHQDFQNRINKIGQSSLIEIDDNLLFEQVPETIEKQYLRTVPIIDTSFLTKKPGTEYFDPAFKSISLFNQ